MPNPTHDHQCANSQVHQSTKVPQSRIVSPSSFLFAFVLMQAQRVGTTYNASEKSIL
jgi:hypothetical protein